MMDMDFLAAHDSVSKDYLWADPALVAMDRAMRQIRRSFLAYRHAFIKRHINELTTTAIEYDSNGIEIAISEGSRETALYYAEVISQFMTLPHVTLDNRGKVCMEWGSVHGRYVLIKFGDDGAFTSFYQSDARGAVRHEKVVHSIGEEECRKKIPLHL